MNFRKGEIVLVENNNIFRPKTIRAVYNQTVVISKGYYTVECDIKYIHKCPASIKKIFNGSESK